MSMPTRCVVTKTADASRRASTRTTIIQKECALLDNSCVQKDKPLGWFAYLIYICDSGRGIRGRPARVRVTIHRLRHRVRYICPFIAIGTPVNIVVADVFPKRSLCDSVFPSRLCYRRTGRVCCGIVSIEGRRHSMRKWMRPFNPGRLRSTVRSGEGPGIPHIADRYFAAVIIGVSLPGGSQRHKIGQTYLTLRAFPSACIYNARLRQHKGDARHRYNGIHSRKATFGVHNYLPRPPKAPGNYFTANRPIALSVSIRGLWF
jgi:hypothetical protein